MRLPTPMQLLARLATVAIGACLTAVAPAAPAPGTSLDNTAQSTFVDAGTGAAGQAASNTVHALVAATQSARLTPASSTIATHVAGFAIPARLTNDGNVATTYFAQFALVPGGNLVPQGARLVDDLNGNGIADPGEPVITPTTALTLAPGASINLLIVGTVAPGGAVGSATTFTLTAQSQDASVTKTATARLVSGGPAQAVVTSTTSPTAPVQGGTLTVAVEAHTTDVPVIGSGVTVDGVAQTLVLLRVPIPANTSLATAASTTGAATLYHRRSDPPNQFFTTPGPLANVDGIAFALASLTAGQSLAGTVAVAIANNASGTLRSTTTFTFNDQGIDRSAAATPIALNLPSLQSSIKAYGTAAYQNPIGVLRTGSMLYLRLSAAQCNLDTDTAETEVVVVTSKLTGDVEHVTLVESGPNTGIFNLVTPLRTANAAGSQVRADDGTLQTVQGDQLMISASACGSDAAIDSLLVDPAGVVFDSRTDQPVPGVTVSLIDVLGLGNGGHPGGAAKVYGYDGVSDYPSTLVTDASGGYMFPLVAASTYRLVLTTPAGYRAPSIVPLGQLPAERFVDALGSYGGNVVVDGTRVVIVDVPVDASPVDGLFVEKTASKAFAEIGDFVDYAVTVKNTSAVAMPAVVLHDHLPRGFAYQRGTSRVAGVKTVDPVGTSTLDIAVGAIASGQAATVTYRLRIGVGAKGGDGVNKANATAGLSRSNTASVKVSLSEGGVFSDRAYLIGKVFADCNGNRVQDAGERGIPDVRIVLEDGTSATTDEDGKYSLYGLIARTHVAKVDTTTLVDGTTLEVLDNRNAGDAGSRFVDLKNGELQRADFAVAGCAPALLDAIEQRRGAVTRISESDSATRALLSATRATTVDPRTLPSSGVLDAKGVVGRNGLAADASTSDPLDRSATSRLRAAVDQPLAGETASVATPDLASRIPTLDAALGFVDLVDGAVLPASQATIRAKGPADTPWALFVDGQRVDDRQVGTRSIVADRNLAAVEYVGVDLAAGDNGLELVATDPFGNVRARAAIRVRAPGRLAKLVIDAPAEAKADGRSSIKARVRLLDANDVPVTARTAVTLDASHGKWLAKDLDPREPGTQVFVEGGVLDVDLLAPNDAGKALLRASSGNLKTETPIAFVPDLRPLLAVGLIEGVINLRSLGSNALVPSQGGDTFEREIRNVARDFDNGKAGAAARGALYLKGKVLGSTLLTLAYDSDKPQRERLFRDIQPDQFYPVYGDSSVKGFDAQSTSRLYVRVDQGTSYLLYGDYTTQTDDPARSLTPYNRALTGAKGRYEEGPVRVDGFAAYTNSQQVIDELRGDGTSGPYALSRPNGLVNSEQVHILTRDRDQPAIVIKDVPLTRFADYELEAFTGRILFKAPIPSVDADLNPVSIRVTYEVDSGGPNFWVGGVDAKVAVTDQASVGGTWIRDTDPSNRATLRGVNGTIRFTEKSVLVGEFAESDSDRYGLGKGRRVEYKQDDETVQARIYGGKTDLRFFNPSALLSQGRTEFGGKLGVKLSEQDRLIVDAIRTEDPVDRRSSRRCARARRTQLRGQHQGRARRASRERDRRAGAADQPGCHAEPLQQHPHEGHGAGTLPRRRDRIRRVRARGRRRQPADRRDRGQLRLAERRQAVRASRIHLEPVGRVRPEFHATTDDDRRRHRLRLHEGRSRVQRVPRRRRHRRAQRGGRGRTAQPVAHRRRRQRHDHGREHQAGRRPGRQPLDRADRRDRLHRQPVVEGIGARRVPQRHHVRQLAVHDRRRVQARRRDDAARQGHLVGSFRRHRDHRRAPPRARAARRRVSPGRHRRVERARAHRGQARAGRQHRQRAARRDRDDRVGPSQRVAVARPDVRRPLRHQARDRSLERLREPQHDAARGRSPDQGHRRPVGRGRGRLRARIERHPQPQLRARPRGRLSRRDQPVDLGRLQRVGLQGQGPGRRGLHATRRVPAAALQVRREPVRREEGSRLVSAPHATTWSSLRRAASLVVAFGLFVLGLCVAPPALSANTCAAPGRDGPTYLAPTYFPGNSLSAPAGTSTLLIGTARLDANASVTPLLPGDLVLIIQMQDGTYNNGNTSAFGDGSSGRGMTSLGEAGHYEFKTVLTNLAGIVTFTQPLAYTYTTVGATVTQGQRRYQVIRVPQLSAVTISGTVTAPQWDGVTGGVYVIDVTGTLTLNGTIDVSGQGFRGGGAFTNGVLSGSGVADYANVSPLLPTITPARGATKGEGIGGTPRFVGQQSSLINGIVDLLVSGYPLGFDVARGAPGNAGGGGDQHNAGGGGGGERGIVLERRRRQGRLLVRAVFGHDADLPCQTCTCRSRRAPRPTTACNGDGSRDVGGLGGVGDQPVDLAANHGRRRRCGRQQQRIRQSQASRRTTAATAAA